MSAVNADDAAFAVSDEAPSLRCSHRIDVDPAQVPANGGIAPVLQEILEAARKLRRARRFFVITADCSSELLAGEKKLALFVANRIAIPPFACDCETDRRRCNEEEQQQIGIAALRRASRAHFTTAHKAFHRAKLPARRCAHRTARLRCPHCERAG